MWLKPANTWFAESLTFVIFSIDWDQQYSDCVEMLTAKIVETHVDADAFRYVQTGQPDLRHQFSIGV